MQNKRGFLMIELLVSLCVLSIALLGIAQLHQATNCLLMRTNALLDAQDIAHALMVGKSHVYGEVECFSSEHTSVSVARYNVCVPYAPKKSVSFAFYMVA